MSIDRDTNVMVVLVLIAVLFELSGCGSKGSRTPYVCEDCIQEE